MKNKLFKTGLVLMMVFFLMSGMSGTVHSESSNEYPGALHNYSHALGMAFGSTSGGGLSYRYWPQNHGVQLSFFPLIMDDYRFVNFGASWLYLLNPHNKASLYLSTSSSFIYQYDKYYYWHWNQHPVIEENYYLNIGVGPAVEYHLWDVMGINAMVGLGFYDLLGSINTNLSGEIGIFYWF